MRRLTIITQRYEKNIRSYLNGGGDWIIRGEGRADGCYRMSVSYNPQGSFTEMLTAYLEEAAALENPAYGSFPQLLDIARDLRGTPINTEDRERLAEFLRENGRLNTEGYAAFRMAEYNYKLDLMAYGFMKQLLSNKLRVTEH